MVVFLMKRVCLNHYVIEWSLVQNQQSGILKDLSKRETRSYHSNSIVTQLSSTFTIQLCSRYNLVNLISYIFLIKKAKTETETESFFEKCMVNGRNIITTHF